MVVILIILFAILWLIASFIFALVAAKRELDGVEAKKGVEGLEQKGSWRRYGGNAGDYTIEIGVENAVEVLLK